MRIACPNCHAAYEVPEPLLAAGKPVRCARCGNEWRPISSAAAPAPVPEPRLEPPAPLHAPALEERLRTEPRLAGYRPRSVDTADDARPPPRDDEINLAPNRRGALLAWLVSLAILALLIWAAFAFRNQVMGAWPPSTRLYAVLGLQ